MSGKKMLESMALAVAVLCCPLAAMAGNGFFVGLESANHIYGKKVTPKDLKGKVIFFEYWGVHCPPCRASFPHLVELQKKYAKTGKFTVLASHVQTTAEEAKKFCEQQGVTFPVYHQYRNPDAKCPGGIPHAFLIDHTGKIVKHGHPSELYSLVAKLVKDAPAAIMGGLKAQFWKNQEKALASGKPIGPILKSLKQASSGDTPKAKEAAAIVEVVEAYLKDKGTALLEMAKTKPAKALAEMKPFLKQAAGTEMEGEIKSVYAKLYADSSVKALAAMRAELTKIQATLAKRDSRGTRKKLEALKAKIAKFAEKNGITPEVAAEAKALAESL